VTPEEAFRVEAMGGGGHKRSKECVATCQGGSCFRVPPAYKCCYVLRPNTDKPEKPLREWYCNNQLVGK
jgi:hypothetical protein